MRQDKAVRARQAVKHARQSRQGNAGMQPG
jgi:hypothetical protein